MNRLSRRCALTFIAVVSFTHLGWGAGLEAQVNEDVAAFTGPTDPAELEAFIDGLMVAHLDELNTAGAVVSVVRDGELFFAKGYGYADYDAEMLVDAESTLFRIGSVSKLFVWTSVMQLVEDGMLDLDADVNQYLDTFQIPDTYSEPVTLNRVMAHAAGFEDWIVGLFADDTSALKPLGEILAEQIPARVRPPGDVSSYSNHATGMAAYIVEVVSGMPWEDFVQERIFDPLGMSYATFAQPLPDRLLPHMSKGYTHSGGKFHEEDFELVPLAPVGAAAISAADMAKFMVAHLQLGRFGEENILREETARQMQSDSYRMAPGVNSMSHGFMDKSRNGQRIIGHGGNTFWFHSNLALFPEHDLGLFVSYNSEDGSAGTGKFTDAFVDRYFPVDRERPVAPEDFLERSSRFLGHFRANRFSHESLAKVAALETVEVTASDDAMLNFLGTQWAEVAPLTFRDYDGENTVVFREAEDGSISHFFLADVPVVAFERVPGSEGPGLHLFVFVFAITMIVGTVLSWPVGWMLRRWYGVSAATLERMPAPKRLVLVSAAFLFLIFLLGMAIVLSDPNQIAIAIPTALSVLLAFPIVAGLLTLVAAYFTVLLWRRGEGRLTGRVLYSAAVVSFVLFVWQLHVWNLLGWRF